MKKFHQLTLNLFSEPTATQLILDFAEEEMICVFYSLCDPTGGQRAFFLFPISEVVAACRRERTNAHFGNSVCSEENMRGCIDEMRVGTYECSSCFVQIMQRDVAPVVVPVHPMNFISESDRG